MFKQPLPIQTLKRLCEVLIFQTTRFNLVDPEKLRKASQVNIVDPEKAISILCSALKELKYSI